MNWKEDKTLIVLCTGLLFFTAMVMVAVYGKGESEKLYALFSGICGQFSGALFMYLKGEKSIPPPGSVTHVEQVTQTPPMPPDAK